VLNHLPQAIDVTPVSVFSRAHVSAIVDTRFKGIDQHLARAAIRDDPKPSNWALKVFPERCREPAVPETSTPSFGR
jgi:hypothetical protein